MHVLRQYHSKNVNTIAMVQIETSVKLEKTVWFIIPRILQYVRNTKDIQYIINSAIPKIL